MCPCTNSGSATDQQRINILPNQWTIAVQLSVLCDDIGDYVPIIGNNYYSDNCMSTVTLIRKQFKTITRHVCENNTKIIPIIQINEELERVTNYQNLKIRKRVASCVVNLCKFLNTEDNFKFGKGLFKGDMPSFLERS